MALWKDKPEPAVGICHNGSPGTQARNVPIRIQKGQMQESPHVTAKVCRSAFDRTRHHPGLVEYSNPQKAMGFRFETDPEFEVCGGGWAGFRRARCAALGFPKVPFFIPV